MAVLALIGVVLIAGVLVFFSMSIFARPPRRGRHRASRRVLR